MAWTWIRPTDPRILDPRPLLDLGVGDGQTLAALAKGTGAVVGLDRSLGALKAARRVVRSPLVRAEANRLPFGDERFAVVLAADLFHHLSTSGLRAVLEEAVRVLKPGGRLVGWWYERRGRADAGSPRYPRAYEDVQAMCSDLPLKAEKLALRTALEPAPPTVGLTAIKNG